MVDLSQYTLTEDINDLTEGTEFIQNFDGWQRGVIVSEEEYVAATNYNPNIHSRGDCILAKWEKYRYSWNYFKRYPTMIRKYTYDPNQQGDREDDI